MKIFVGGIKETVTNVDLKDYFSQFGDIADAYVARNFYTGESLYYGYITFCEPASLNKTLSVTKHVVCGKRVEIRRFEPVKMPTRIGKMDAR